MRKGFTLVEVLIVIAVISVLMAVLLPATSEARNEGRRAACLSNIRQLGIAMNVYLTAYNEYFPAYDPFNEALGAHMYWDNILRDYMNTEQTDVFACPSHLEFNWSTRMGSYGYNLDGLPDDHPPGGGFGFGNQIMRLSEGTRLGASMVLGESGGWDAMPSVGRTEVHRTGFLARMSERHRGGSNILFGDASARLHLYSALHPSDQDSNPNGESSDMFWYFKDP